MKKKLLFLLPLIALCFSTNAQTVTITATGAPGSYKTGWVDDLGNATDGDITVSLANMQRGWAVFDLSTLSIPASATITNVVMSIDRTSVTGTSITLNIDQVYGIATDLSTVSGTALYADCQNTPFLYSGNWGLTASNPTTFPLNANGVAFIQANYNAVISMGLVVASGGLTTVITGEGGTNATLPKLTITYTLPCTGQPTIGTAGSDVSAACSNTNITLSLTGGDAFQNGFTYQWQSSPTGMGTWANIGTASTSSTYTFSGQTVASDYRCILVCSGSGLQDTSNIITITELAGLQCYCIPNPGSDGCDGGDDVNDFILTGANSTSINDVGTGCVGVSAYDDRTYDTVALIQGGLYTAQISSEYEDGGSEDQDVLTIWIDFNDDVTFDATEMVCSFYGVSTNDLPAAINIPGTATLGYHRMRVMVGYDGGGLIMDPCNGGSSPWDFGETHDYVANIIAAPPCDTVTGLAVSGITSVSATLNWNAVAGAAGYEYTVDTNPGAPSAAGTGTIATTASPGGLTSGTQYYAHVRVNCGSSYSLWITVPFNTLVAVCDTVTGLTAMNITSTGVTASWNAVAGATGYEYLVDTNPGTPSGAGIPLTTTAISPTGLTPGTVYYIHVRVNCTGGNSTWITITFTTAPLGISGQYTNSFNVTAFPNPAKSTVTIQVSAQMGNNAKVLITDLAGRVVRTVNITTNSTDVDLSGIAAGTYFIKYEDDVNTRIIKLNKF